MKINYLTFLCCLFFSTRMLAGDTTEVECLDVYGYATADKKPIDGVTITIYQENEEKEMALLTNVSYHNHRFEYKFNTGGYYSIKIEKDGYVPRLIGIYTNLPKNVSPDPVFIYDMEVEMVKEDKEKQDQYYIDFPVALIAYDPGTRKFGYSTKYTDHIKALMNKTVEAAKADSKK